MKPVLNESGLETVRLAVTGSVTGHPVNEQIQRRTGNGRLAVVAGRFPIQPGKSLSSRKVPHYRAEVGRMGTTDLVERFQSVQGSRLNRLGPGPATADKSSSSDCFCWLLPRMNARIGMQILYFIGRMFYRQLAPAYLKSDGPGIFKKQLPRRSSCFISIRPRHIICHGFASGQGQR